MTVADNTSRNQYTATSGQTVFAYTFEIVDKDHIVVLKNGVALSEGTDYAVSNVGNDNGGNITLTSGATAGDIMTLYREMPYSRTQNYTNSGDFLASEVNSDFDELWLAGEQTDRAFSQSIRKPITDSDSISMELPKAVDRADTFLTFDSNGAVSVSPIEDGINPATISRDQFTGDGSTTLFTLTSSKGNERSVVIYIDGVYQEADSYNVAGFSLTFTEAPPLNSSIEALLFKVYDITNIEASEVSVLDAGGYYTSSTVEGALQEVGADIAGLDSGNYLNVKEFGATGDGSTDDTTAIQSAINHASSNKIQTIFFPDGHYKYTTLRFYHDATDNPDFQATPNRDGRFQLRGTGRLAITDLKNVGKSPGRIYGSILESTSSGSGLIVEPTGTFSGTDARNFVAKDLTLVADNTGYIVTAESCPGLTFDHCSFKQLNHQGSGILARNCWFFTMNQCYVFGQSWFDEDFATAGQTEFLYTFDNPASTSDIIVQKKGGLVSSSDYSINTTTKVVTLNAGADLNDKVTISRKNTGDGISSQFVGSAFGSFAGLWNITDSLVDSWANGVHWTGGTVTNLSLRNTGVQNCNNYNIHADAGVIQQMLLDNVYMENQSVQGVSFIKGDGTAPPENSAVIRNLRMINCFFLAGGTFPRVTGTCIDVDNIDVIDIEGMYVFRMRQPFLNITRTKNSQNVPGEIKNSIFTTDQDLSAEPTIYLLSGKIPNVHNCVWPGFSNGFYDTTNDILLFDPTVESNFPRQYTDIKGTTGIAKFGFGDTKVVTGITSGPYNITGSDSRTYYDLTHSIAGGLKAILPDTGEVNDGRLIIIKNNEASTSTAQFPYINVVNNSDQATTIGRLSPGQAGLFVLDKQDSTKFKYVGRTFTDNLEFTDDHKITFGRSDDLQIFHQSSDSTNRLVSGSANFALPTADGTAGQSIITDGSGNLAFGTAAGTGITAVVEDTTPQLGGDLESNGNDILFADNDKAVFGAGSDLQIYHNGLNSFINDAGTGNLYIRGSSSIRLEDSSSNKAMATFTQDAEATLFYNNSAKLATTSTGIDVTGSINTVLSVDGTTEDVFITGAVPGFELVESDNGGSRVRYAVNNSALFQSLYGADTSTFGSTTVQTRLSDGTSNQVIYTYDGGANDYHWWGTRGGGDRLVQIDSNGKFRVRGGDVSFFDDGVSSEAFFWDASTSRLGLGTTSPDYALNLEGSEATILIHNTTGSPDQALMIFQADMGTNNRNFQIKSPATDSSADPFRFVTGNSFAFEIDSNDSAFVIDSNANIGIGTNPDSDLHIYGGGNTVLNMEHFQNGSSRIYFSSTSDGRWGAINATNTSGARTIAITPNSSTGDSRFGGLLLGQNEATIGGVFDTDYGLNVYGDVGINNTNPQAPLHVNGDSAYGEAAIFQNDGNATSWARADWLNDQVAGSGIVFRDQGGGFYFRNDNNTGTAMNTYIVAGGSTAGNIVFQKDSTSGGAGEVARFDTSGRLLIGRSTSNVNETGLRLEDVGGNHAQILISKTDSGNKTAIGNYHNGTYVGGVNYSDTATSFPTSSDQRLKDNIVDAPSASDDIDAIQVRSFDWKADGSHQKYGMVAQELQGVAPEAVSEGDTEADMMGVDYSKLVPMLVKEIQSLRARVAQLEND